MQAELIFVIVLLYLIRWCWIAQLYFKYPRVQGYGAESASPNKINRISIFVWVHVKVNVCLRIIWGMHLEENWKRYSNYFISRLEEIRFELESSSKNLLNILKLKEKIEWVESRIFFGPDLVNHVTQQFAFVLFLSFFAISLFIKDCICH